MAATLPLVEDALVKVAKESATTPGTPGVFSPVLYLTDYEVSHDSGDPEETYFFAAADPFVAQDDDVDTYSFSGARALGDLTGQDVIINARRTRGLIWIQVLPDGVKGEQQKIRITAESYSGARNGGEKYTTGSFDARGYGPVTQI